MTHRLFDPRLKGRLGRYLWQCGLATLIVLGILALLDIVLHAAIIATLGASSFIVFAMPSSRAAQLRPLLGGYLIGTSVGIACSMLTSALAVVIAPNTAMVLCAALAVGAAILGMVITNTEHPPAAGMALSLVLNPWDARTVTCALGAIALLGLSRWALRRMLVDLA